MYESHLKKSLARKYAMRRLLPFLDALKRSKESLVTFVQVIIGCAIIAYFLAHFIVYIIDSKQPKTSVYHYPHQIVITRR